MQENEHVLCGTKDEKHTFVYFHNEERIGVKQLRLWNEIHADCNVIIVSLEGPTAFTKKEADQNYENIQFFLFKDLCVNITKHAIVPKHELLDTTEVQKINYQISDNGSEWPKLYTTDAISQYYNFKPGNLIRITRTIGTQEPVYYYRLVCTPPIM